MNEISATFKVESWGSAELTPEMVAQLPPATPDMDDPLTEVWCVTEGRPGQRWVCRVFVDRARAERFVEQATWTDDPEISPSWFNGDNL